MGCPAYPRAAHLLITADAGDSNGSRLRLWKWELQKCSNRTGLTIAVCHASPGASTWNKIEQRLGSHIAMNWRGKPHLSLATVVSLIASTRTETGLRIRVEIDREHYPGGVTVTDAPTDQIHLQRSRFHGDWNYTIRPIT